MNTTQKRFGLSGSTLKLIAIVTMLIDHTGATLLRTMMQHYKVAGTLAQSALWTNIYNTSRDIGRFAFPIFCFLIVEGFLHTRNVTKYVLRMFVFCIISEIPFDRALKGAWYFPQKQNVYFTLLIGLLVLIAIRLLTDDLQKHIYLSVLPIAAGMWLSAKLLTDYNYKGVFLIAILYLLKRNRLAQCVGGALASAWELPAPHTFLFVYFYNGERGLNLKYFFYLFYPCHLMLLYMFNSILQSIL